MGNLRPERSRLLAQRLIPEASVHGEARKKTIFVMIAKISAIFYSRHSLESIIIYREIFRNPFFPSCAYCSITFILSEVSKAI